MVPRQDDRPTHITRDIVLPMSLILGMLGLSFNIGVWKSSQEKDNLATAALASATATLVKSHESELLTLRSESISRDAEVKRLWKALQSLRDYTEGRIQQMPYRQPGPPSDQEGNQ